MFGNQVKTLSLQTSYDSKLNNATYDALKAFQLNTINSSTSDLANSKLRDIEASVNSFFNSISSNFNMAGYNKDILKDYVPALVYTMYDGYYIYSPYTNKLSEEDFKEGVSTYQDGQTISGLKPYIYYSCRYKRDSRNDDFVITYSLDNYITIQGIIKGESVFASGYLISNCDGDGENSATYRNINIESEKLSENGLVYDNDNAVKEEVSSLVYTKINGVKYYTEDNGANWYSVLNGEKYKQNKFKTQDTSGIKYYSDAKEFRKKILDDYELGDLSTNDAVDESGNKIYDYDDNNNQLGLKFGNSKIFEGYSDNYQNTAIEEPNSNFNQHRLAVIRYSIEKNLSIAIANYNNYTGVTTNFQMPKLKEDEWNKILNNISIISFMQGLNIGGKIYNGYSIITNTKNQEVVNEESIYMVDRSQYYKITDKSLENNTNIEQGVLNIDFERKSYTDKNGATKYFFPKTQLGAYTSIVNQSNLTDTSNIYDYVEGLYKQNPNSNLATKYFTALGRERYSMYKTNNNSAELQKQFQGDITPTDSSTKIGAYSLGDINNDGKVDEIDLEMQLNHVSRKQSLTEDQKTRADINGDGKITLQDLMMLLHHISGYYDVVIPQNNIGDINNDGEINQTDLNMILSHVSGSQPLTENQKSRADINKDGEITLKDLLMLMRYIENNKN